ncbi:ribonuclease P protein component [Natronospora cellulosivora (SeqCode)]
MDSLKKNSEFRRVYTRGKSIATRNLVLYFFPNKTNSSKLGLSISKKIGNAVTRNKLRRRIKEIVRLKKNIKNGYDFIFIARKPIVRLEYSDIEKDVNNLIKRAGLEIKGEKK